MHNTTPPSPSAMAITTETVVVGSHVLTIDGYTKATAALTIGETIQSDQFSVGGQSWYIKCCPRRKDKDGVEWVSVHLCLNHYGATRLDEEVKASPNFILLDRARKAIRSRGSSHLVHTFTMRHPDWGFDEFIQRKELEAHLLIDDDDCCRIRCDVTVIKEPPVVAPSDDLHGSNLGDLLLASEAGRDVTFVVGGELFTAHSCVLAARTSMAFMAEVLAGKEISTVAGGSRRVQVDGVAPWVFRALLHFIYTDSLPDVEDEEADFDVRIGVARALLAAAYRYDMERLKMICTDVLCSNTITATALPTLLLSHKLGSLKLNQACVKYIRDMLDGYSLEETT